MKQKLLLSFTVYFFVISCNDNEPKKKLNAAADQIISIFETSYHKYTDHPYFEDYEKVSDTSFYLKDFAPEYGILEIKKGKRTLVVFKDFLRDENSHEIGFRVLDTLHLDSIVENHFLSIGYCFEGSSEMTNIIAVIEKTPLLHPKNILRAWKANPVTKEIEEIGIDSLKCWNEHYEE